MILDKCWTTAKHKFPHLPGKPVFCETQPAYYNTARTSEVFTVQFPVIHTRLLVLCLPINLQGLGNLPEVPCWVIFLLLQSKNSMSASQTSVESTGPSCCRVHRVPILLCTLQNLMRRHLSYMLRRLPPCTQACVPYDRSPHLGGPEAQQLEKGLQKDKIQVILRKTFFSSSPSSLLEIPGSLSSELPEPLRLFLYRQTKSLFSCEGYLAHMQVLWRN